MKDEDPLTLWAVRLTPSRQRFWRQIGALFLIGLGLGAVIGLFAVAQILLCPQNKTAMECLFKNSNAKD